MSQGGAKIGQCGAKVGQDAQMWLPCTRELDFDCPKAPKGGPRRQHRSYSRRGLGRSQNHTLAPKIELPPGREQYFANQPKRTQRKV